MNPSKSPRKTSGCELKSSRTKGMQETKNKIAEKNNRKWPQHKKIITIIICCMWNIEFCCRWRLQCPNEIHPLVRMALCPSSDRSHSFWRTECMLLNAMKYRNSSLVGDNLWRVCNCVAAAGVSIVGRARRSKWPKSQCEVRTTHRL